MLGVGGLMMAGSGRVCSTDSSAASRSFFLRGDGANNTAPSTDDLGNTLTPSASGRTKFNNTYKYWDSYSTSLYADTSGLTTAGSAFNLGGSSTPFSILWRARYVTGTGSEIVQPIFVTGNGFSSWGPGGLQNELRVVGSGTVRWSFYGGANPTIFDFSHSSSFMDGFHEFMVTFDGTTTYGYVDGVRQATLASSYTPINQTLTTKLFSTDDATYCRAYYNDFTVYQGVCLSTATSYTLATNPAC